MSRRRVPHQPETYVQDRKFCATCGAETRGKHGGFGSFHYDCARDAAGHLLTVDEPREREVGAAV